MRSTCTVTDCAAPVVGGGLCRKHYMRKRRSGSTETTRFDPIGVRFWRYVNKSAGCWLWTAAKTPKGYGRFVVSQRPTRIAMAHRFAYELEVGPIPAGMTIDHLCKNQSCVNPAHFEVVTRSENAKRGNPLLTHCKRGHELSGDNLYFPPDGAPRQCRTCRSEVHARTVARFGKDDFLATKREISARWRANNLERVRKQERDRKQRQRRLRSIAQRDADTV